MRALNLRLAIIADDLTGALDSAEPFARAGAVVTVATSVEAAGLLPFGTSQVLAVNADSRHLPPKAAAAAMARAWDLIAAWQPDFLFKKIDSRLKGNVATELDALLAASGRTAAIVAPAIPAIGRVVHGGMLTGFGIEQPLQIAALPSWRGEWAVPDCADSAAMEEVAGRLLAGRETAIAVGSSGLAEALANALWPRSPGNSPASAQGTPADRRMVMAIGSRDPITLGQLEELSRSRQDSQIVLLRPPPGEQDPEQVATQLAQRALDIARSEGIRTLLLSGGDTAAAFVRLAGIDLLTPLHSLLPGIPAARGIADGTEYTLITKSGGFGPGDALSRLYRLWSGTA